MSSKIEFRPVDKIANYLKSRQSFDSSSIWKWLISQPVSLVHSESRFRTWLYHGSSSKHDFLARPQRIPDQPNGHVQGVLELIALFLFFLKEFLPPKCIPILVFLFIC